MRTIPRAMAALLGRLPDLALFGADYPDRPSAAIIASRTTGFDR
jgi:hypothetical protein